MILYHYHFFDKDIRYDIISNFWPRYRYDIISSKKKIFPVSDQTHAKGLKQTNLMNSLKNDNLMHITRVM
jgi:hypothetical protein